MDANKNILRKYIKEHNLTFDIGEISELSEIGEGGNGLVFSGNLHELPVAVKFLVNPSSARLQRFKAEYLNVLLLPANEYVVKMLAYQEFTIEGVRFSAILMKKYENKLLRPENPDIKKLHSLTNFLLKSIGFIHSNGIIHRDLKPDNILVGKNEAVLSDFGIASYNPEIFKLQAETRKGERVGNRMFSAPEQEEPNTPAHVTMDIYAIGQILHWYTTGNIHRGTQRINISTFIPQSEVYDSIIDRCLANKPEDRFQSIDEIISAIKRTEKEEEERKRHYYDDPYKYIYPFSAALAASFPKDGNIVFTDDKKKINRLITNIAEKCNFEKYLDFVDSQDHSLNFNFTKLDEDTWLMGFNGDGEEIRIKSVWVNNDSSLHADFILINCEAMPPFGVYDTDTLTVYKEIRERHLAENENAYSRMLFLAHESVGLVDGEFYITSREFDNGYAEVDSEVIDLSERKVNFRERTLEERSLVIASNFHSILQRENLETLLSYLVEHNGGHGIDRENFSELVWKIRKNQHYLVRESL